ncbi:sulfotransferase 1C2-like isoform X3 [Mytilus californianus]|uniref:sulfotransferase 1C2-like isoform X1 n=2 Tax=Mytilus californianus TaxID=6549 RepID=UPI0022466C25|nr:sulfotransferase 1C2-like isoform X1 [Mytilus californianus]XP_052101808.1 sulfotransferase 1C2-like isoform X2 [Mytilus californianus]XP_052101809.1 sulfotransferase 1C2-like isoform X3 [Mytilus californianus]
MIAKGKYHFGPITDEDEVVTVTLSEDMKVENLVVDEFETGINFRKNGILPDPRIMIPQIQTMDVFDDDIFICAYMKCGTHWVWEMVQMIVNGKTEYYSKAKECCMLEFHLPDEYSDLQRPRIFNSHFTPKCLPKQAFEKKCKMIIIERNPKDILTSQYHHWKLFPQFSLQWSDFLKSVYTNDRNVSSNWFFYRKQWSDFLSSSDNPCLVLKYEDIKQNTLASLFKLADFLGYPREETFLKEIQEKCSLEKMRDMEKLRESGTELVNSDQVSKLYRKGVVGDWKNNFTVAQNEQFEALLKTKLNGVDVNYTYEL